MCPIFFFLCLFQVGSIDVREGRIYVGQLPDNVSPNILGTNIYGLYVYIW